MVQHYTHNIRLLQYLLEKVKKMKQTYFEDNNSAFLLSNNVNDMSVITHFIHLNFYLYF